MCDYFVELIGSSNQKRIIMQKKTFHRKCYKTFSVANMTSIVQLGPNKGIKLITPHFEDLTTLFYNPSKHQPHDSVYEKSFHQKSCSLSV